jgi:Raf kinase inhibitor-like YbhB/YbcL family protein
MNLDTKGKSPPGLFFTIILILGAGCRASAPTQTPQGEADMSIQITSPAFEAGGTIPSKYTCDGADVSPPLNWSGVPDGAQSLALIVDDPDAPAKTWVHWVLHDLSPGIGGIEEGDFAGGVQGRNDFGNVGYNGPCPPGSSSHRYFFKLYALDARLGLDTTATKRQVEDAMKGHILSQGQLMAKYGR